MGSCPCCERAACRQASFLNSTASGGIYDPDVDRCATEVAGAPGSSEAIARADAERPDGDGGSAPADRKGHLWPLRIVRRGHWTAEAPGPACDPVLHRLFSHRIQAGPLTHPLRGNSTCATPAQRGLSPPQACQLQPAAGREVHMASERILLVDDEENARSALRSLL